MEKVLNKELSYEQAIDILTSQGKFYINLGLDRVQNILNLLNNPQNSLKFIHVAGTNGKGSVCAMLSAILSANGFKTGLFTSPHVFEYNERIKINDIEIPRDDFAKGVKDIVELAEKNEIHLTEFEILTVLAFKYFAQNNLDIVILETGLGGRFDATNVIENNICSIITNINFDHTERLGDTIEKIAFEKAGIIKNNCPVIINKSNLGLDVIKNFAKGKKSEVFSVFVEENFPVTNLSLHGIYQKENLALVLKVIDILNLEISEKELIEALKNVKHPCRFEYLEKYNILIDGAHNPNGTKALRDSLSYYFPNQKFKFIFGCLKNKEYSKMMENLFTPKDDIYFYTFNNINSASYQELAEVCQVKAEPFKNYTSDSNTLTVICGSFYMIKELLEKMGIK